MIPRQEYQERMAERQKQEARRLRQTERATEEAPNVSLPLPAG